MTVKQILERLERLKDETSDPDLLDALDRLTLDIEIDCRREGVELVTC